MRWQLPSNLTRPEPSLTARSRVHGQSAPGGNPSAPSHTTLNSEVHTTHTTRTHALHSACRLHFATQNLTAKHPVIHSRSLSPSAIQEPGAQKSCRSFSQRANELARLTRPSPSRFLAWLGNHPACRHLSFFLVFSERVYSLFFLSLPLLPDRPPK
ncbi:hypothetical protein CTA2_11024 [Colletotrichum tanaceti]|nr:hypothetical protein CTA2_11024 [Colletotrichum tanaceti]